MSIANISTNLVLVSFSGFGLFGDGGAGRLQVKGAEGYVSSSLERAAS